MDIASAPHPYIPNTDEDRLAMLDVTGASSVEELFADIPPEFRIEGLRLPPALSELELMRELSALAATNRVPGRADAQGKGLISFLGAGSYRRFIPSLVDHVIGRSEYYTSYTPYQPEISQGTLQTAFEFQSMVCELMGMDVANASMYDGASALAEACLMASSITGRQRIAVLSTVNPDYISVIRTYAQGRELAVDILEAGTAALTTDHACLAVQHPNYLGYLEDMPAWKERTHSTGALYITCVDPISLGLLTPPGDIGADIAVGEGQGLGWPTNFGGPYLGLFACRRDYLRRMPGRIVGRASDPKGRTGYVLTLQTREQHIRRERATSNICTSQQLVALAATVYLATLGKRGLRRIAELCYHKAHYATTQIAQIDGYSLMEGMFFQEFVARCPHPPAEINRRLLEHGIIGGVDVSNHIENGLLVCVTELNTREEIDRLVAALAELSA